LFIASKILNFEAKAGVVVVVDWVPVEESGNVLRRVLQESLLQQEFNALFRVHVELLPSERELFGPGCIFTVKIKKKILRN
jgi:hypothetical protein